MRSVVTRVTRADVVVGGRCVAAIGAGVLALVGVGRDDGPEQARTLARKVHELRILRDERSVADVADAGVLVVSQFTLYGDTRRGRRPSWMAAAPAGAAQPLIELFVATLRERGAAVATGVFGADMRLTSTNDGPVTVLLEV